MLSLALLSFLAIATPSHATDLFGFAEGGDVQPYPLSRKNPFKIVNSWGKSTMYAPTISRRSFFDLKRAMAHFENFKTFEEFQAYLDELDGWDEYDAWEDEVRDWKNSKYTIEEWVSMLDENPKGDLIKKRHDDQLIVNLGSVIDFALRVQKDVNCDKSGLSTIVLRLPLTCNNLPQWKNPKWNEK